MARASCVSLELRCSKVENRPDIFFELYGVPPVLSTVTRSRLEVDCFKRMRFKCEKLFCFDRNFLIAKFKNKLACFGLVCSMICIDLQRFVTRVAFKRRLQTSNVRNGNRLTLHLCANLCVGRPLIMVRDARVISLNSINF